MNARARLAAVLAGCAWGAWAGGSLAAVDDGLRAGFAQAQALAGADPAQARLLLDTLRSTAVAEGRPAWRLAVDELGCRLLSDIDPEAGLAVAQAGVASAAVAATADTPTILALLRLKACRAGLELDLGHKQAGDAALAEVLATAAPPALAGGRAMALLERGLHRSRGGDYIGGQQDLLEACAALRTAGTPFDQSLCTWHLANHFKRVGDLDEALGLMKPLLAEARQRRARQDEGIYLYGIAVVHAMREDWPQALDHFGQALGIETAKPDALGMAYAECGLADALLQLRRAPEALPRIQHALELLATQDDKFQRLRANILLARTQLALGRADDAAIVLLRAAPDVQTYGDDVIRSEWLGPQAAVQARLGHWHEAYDALAAEREITTRLQAQKLSQQTARLRLQFNRERDEQNIRGLERAYEQGQHLRQLQGVALTLFVLLLAASLAYAVHKVRESRRLRTLSLSDELTGLPNRRAAMAQARAGVQAAREKSGTFSVLVIDVDHFKRVNDTHGHAVGDDVLRHLARVLPSSLRSLDRLGRIGGEEFLALLPNASTEQAAAVAERMRASVAAEGVPTGAGPLALTVSIGVATLAGADDTVESLIARADRALYAAKNGGRNTVVQAGG